MIWHQKAGICDIQQQVDCHLVPRFGPVKWNSIKSIPKSISRILWGGLIGNTGEVSWFVYCNIVAWHYVYLKTIYLYCIYCYVYNKIVLYELIKHRFL